MSEDILMTKLTKIGDTTITCSRYANSVVIFIINKNPEVYWVFDDGEILVDKTPNARLSTDETGTLSMLAEHKSREELEPLKVGEEP